MPQRGEVGAQRRAAEIVEGRASRPRGGAPRRLHERGDDFLAIGLADRSEPHHGGHKIAARMQGEGGERRAKLQPMGEERRPESNRISDLARAAEKLIDLR